MKNKCVPSELIRARESFCAAREGAGMGLLAGVGADVTGLVLQTVEGLVAKRALVGPGQVLAGLLLGLLLLQKGSHEAHGSSSHGRGRLGRGGRSGCGEGVLRRGGFRVEYAGQVEGLHVISTRGGV